MAYATGDGSTIGIASWLTPQGQEYLGASEKILYFNATAEAYFTDNEKLPAFCSSPES